MTNPIRAILDKITNTSTELAKHSNKYLALIFIAYATPLVIFCTFNVPAFQNPDEPNHLYRAYQISDGKLLGERIEENTSGGKIDPAIMAAAKQYNYISLNEKITKNQITNSSAIQWSKDRTNVQFSNTAIYPPFLYTPISTAIAIGKATGISVIKTIYLARLFNGLTAIALSALALSLCRSGRLLMFTVLLLPMTISLFASCSQDALMISLAAIAAAIISQTPTYDSKNDFLKALIAATILLTISTARPPYAGLFLLLLRFNPSAAGFSITLPTKRSLYLAITPLLVLCIWVIWVSANLQVNYTRPGTAISMHEQVKYLASHYQSIWPIIKTTFLTSNYTQQFIGILGWLDTAMPPSYYKLATFTILIACIGERHENTQKTALHSKIVYYTGILLSAAAIFFIQYLTWTAVGDNYIEGVQGRYFTVLAIFTSIYLPSANHFSLADHVIRLNTLLFPIITTAYLPQVIIQRYYLN